MLATGPQTRRCGPLCAFWRHSWLDCGYDLTLMHRFSVNFQFCVFHTPQLPAMASDRGKPFSTDAFDFALSLKHFAKDTCSTLEPSNASRYPGYS
jgi:hypothetical protein